MNILSNTETYIANLFQKEDTSNLFFHSYAHTLEVVDTASKMAKAVQLGADETEILVLAAWFHDVGYLYTYHEHEAKSITIAKDYLSRLNYAPSKLTKLLDCIAATELSQSPNTQLAALLKDADLAYGVTNHFFERGPLLRLEWQIQLNKSYTALAWEELQFNFLSNIKFYSAYAQSHFKPMVVANLAKQKEILATIKKSLKL